MTIANTVQSYLQDHHVDFELVPHQPAGTSSETAQAAHVPGAKLAKAVVVEDQENHYAMVVVPATEQVHLGELRQELGETVALATEDTIARMFADCDTGSVPPFGQAYGVDVLLDDDLLECDRVYAESGDRGALIALAGDDFRQLMQAARHGHYGHPA